LLIYLTNNYCRFIR